MRILATIGMLGMLLSGCLAQTDVASYTDPAHKFGTHYRDVVVLALGMPLAERQLMEAKAVEALRKLGVRAHAGLQYFPPTRRISKDLIAKARDSTGADALITVVLQDRDVSVSQVPGHYTPGTTTTSFNTIGNYVYATTQTTPGSYSPGYTVKKPAAYYNARLFDLHNGGTMWHAELDSRGAGVTSFDDLVISVAETMASKLRADGLI